MNTKNKLDIENIVKAVNFVKLTGMNFNEEVEILQRNIKKLKNENKLNTQESIDYLLHLYSKLKLPNIDRVLEIVNIINAANNLEKNNKLYYYRKEKFRNKVQELIQNKTIFSANGVLELAGYWRELGLPELSTVINITQNTTSSTQKHANKIGDLSYKNLNQEYVNNIPDHLRKLVLDQINTLEELTGLKVAFNPPTTIDTTNYKLLPDSIYEYVKRTLNNLSKYSKSRAVLR